MIGQRNKDRYPVTVIEGSAIVKGARPYRKSRWYIWARFMLPLLLLVLGGEIFYFTTGSQAVIRFTPVTTLRANLVSVLAVTHPSSTEQSPVHQLRSAQSETVTVNATGTHLQPATAAYGALIWYNASPTEQIVAAHTHITVSAGLQLETEASFTIPAAILPNPGQAEEPAHAIQAGALGNIPANTLVDHVCGCGTGVTVSNTQPFAGGQDATPQSVLLQHDVDSAVAAEQGSLTQQAKDQLHRQAAAGERVIERTCSPQALPDHPIGSILPLHAQVKVAVRVACTGLAYDQTDVQSKALESFRATRPKGTYQLRLPQIRIVNVTVEGNEILHISVQISGRWVYQFTQAAQETLLSRIAGTSSQKAQEELEHFPGIEKAHVECWWLWLPSDPHHITLIEG
jgi:Baseplate J-like protein